MAEINPKNTTATEIYNGQENLKDFLFLCIPDKGGYGMLKQDLK